MSGTSVIIGGSGFDEIKPGNPLSPTTGADSIDGKDGNDIIVDEGGNDTILGGSGDDIIEDKGNGSDILDGGAGSDIIKSEGGNDTVFANENDEVQLAGGNDLVILTNATNPIVQMGDGNDTVFWDGSGFGGDVQGGGGQNVFRFGGEGTTADMFRVVRTGASGHIEFNREGFNANGTPIGGTLDGRIDFQDFAGPLASRFIFTPTQPADQPPCFTTGTRIATTRGEIPVEDLRVGDLVLTPRAAAKVQPIIWIGHTKVNVAAHPKRDAVAPVLVKEGAIAEGVPHRDLRVSPDHAFYIDGRLIPAKHLVNGSSIIQEAWCPQVTYWHVELPQHAIIVSEGAPTESYLDDGNRQNFDNGAIAALFKDFESHRGNGRYDAEACYPLLRSGTLLEIIRGRLMARAAEIERRASAIG
jgi:hypothetical protein